MDTTDHMNKRAIEALSPEEEWRKSIHLFINACSLRYPVLAKKVKIAINLIEQWGKGQELESATMKDYSKLLLLILEERFPTSAGSKDSWHKTTRYLDNQEHDEDPHVYNFDTFILCNRIYLISRIKAVGLKKADAAELFGISLKYLRWATDERKDLGELLCLPIEGYRKIIETFGKAWYVY